MGKKQALNDEHRKLLEVQMWLRWRIGSESDTETKNQMFEAYRLASLAALALETVNYLSNGEYNDENSERQRSSSEPLIRSGFSLSKTGET